MLPPPPCGGTIQALNTTRDRLANVIQEALKDPREEACQQLVSKVLDLQREVEEEEDKDKGLLSQEERLKKKEQLGAWREVRSG